MKKFLLMLSMLVSFVAFNVPVLAADGESITGGDIVKWLIVALIIGFIIALISVTVMKGKLKSVHFQGQASSYIRPGSFKITDQNDLYLYKRVERKEKPQQNQNN